MTQTNNNLLSLAEIVRRTGIDQHVLNRYVKLPENRAALMGASTHPQYPMESLPLFFRLAQEHSVKAITPKTLAGRWTLDNGGALVAQGGAEIAERSAQSATIVGSTPDDLPTICNENATICGNGPAESAERSAEFAVIGDALVREVESVITILERIANAQEEIARAAQADDRVFTADDAAQFLCCSVRLLRRTVPASFRLGSAPAGDRWYKRDLLALKGGAR